VNGLRAGTLTVRFLCELGMLAAFAAWGFETGEGALGYVLGIGAPLAAVAVWGAFIAPKAMRPVSVGTRLMLEVLLFGAAAIALISIEFVALGFTLGALGLGSSFLNAWQELRERR
jgi:Protein of unknown function (DUF2568)